MHMGRIDWYKMKNSMALDCCRCQPTTSSVVAQPPTCLTKRIRKQQISLQKHNCTQQIRLIAQVSVRESELYAASQLFGTVPELETSRPKALIPPLFDTHQDRDKYFMQLALQQAEIAAQKQEVPVGAVIVAADGQTLLAANHNLTHTSQNPIAHAEMLAISQASAKLSNWRLTGATLYCTLEPCPMCAGAILQSRLSRLVYGAKQPRLGADGSWLSMFPSEQSKENIVHGRTKRVSSKEATNNIVAAAIGELDTTSSASFDAGMRIDVSPIHFDCGQSMSSSSDNPQSGSKIQHKITLRHPFHKQISVTRGVLEKESAELLQNFFRRRREA